MIDFTTRFGRTVDRRLRRETIIWLTTVDRDSRPQPRPVWFYWDGTTILIFSQPGAAKLRHLAANPNVALNLNSDPDGGTITVLLGKATLSKRPVHEAVLEAYRKKYRKAIVEMGTTPDQMLAEYSAAIQVRPIALRGF